MNNPVFLFFITVLVFCVVLGVSYRKEGKIKDVHTKLWESVLIVTGLGFGVSLVVYGLNNKIIMGLSEEVIGYMIAMAGAGIIILVFQQFYKAYLEGKDSPKELKFDSESK